MRRALELPELLQPQGVEVTRGYEYRARSAEARGGVRASRRADVKRSPLDPAVRAAQSADLQVEHPRDEEQPDPDRVHLEHRAVEVEVAVPSDAVGPATPVAGPSAPRA